MTRKIIIVLISTACAFYLWHIDIVSKLVSPAYKKATTLVSEISVNKVTPIFPENYELTILDKINQERQRQNKKQLSWSDDLAKAAMTRGVIIKELNDYTGTVSGLTREKSYDLVGYETTYFGDLYIFIKNPDDDFLTSILSDKDNSETMLLDKFTEAGVAKVKNGVFSEYYVLLGNRKAKIAQPVTQQKPTTKKVVWGGPELWEAINKRRTEFGVGQLSKKDELCTIASIRLNQLLELGKLDGHAGFVPTLNREDLKWITEKYNISEFLATGYQTPSETVSGWENTLGHRGLLTGGEYVWGCVYAQNSFAVAISAY